IADDGDGIPVEVLKRESLPAASAPGGRGIWLMRRLSDEVVFLTGPAGTTVRIALKLPAQAGAARAR
ncbi:ATP-binding protein, partial [Nonomuraea wenchangensis]